MLIKAAAAALIKVPMFNLMRQLNQFYSSLKRIGCSDSKRFNYTDCKSSKSLAQISDDMRDLATRAKTYNLMSFRAVALAFQI